jgi:hypothetical protein
MHVPGMTHTTANSAFFSYCREDKPVVGLLAQLLGATGVRVLWDGALQPGQLWGKHSPLSPGSLVEGAASDVG